MNANLLQSPYDTGADLLRELYARNRVLFAVAVGNVALAVLFTGLMQADGRMVLGRNVWTKPWKFATSIAVFTATMGWLLPTLGLPDRVERLATSVIGAVMTVEIVLISAQAARGVRSHFNDSTPLDVGIFAMMGVTITLSTLVVAYVLWRTVRDPPDFSPAYLRGVQLGMFVFVAASFQGWLMFGQGSHSVGVAADSAGLPLLNWKVGGGDLRIAHFIGLHALQVVPLAGYGAARWRRLSERASLAVVGVVATSYGALVASTFALAMRGRPLVASVPDVSLATVFGTSFLLVAPFWALMVFAPGWRLTDRIVESPLIAVAASLLYLLLLGPEFGTVANAVISPSLEGMTTLLGSDFGTTLSWVHFLAFDLFVGQWIYRDARRRDITHLVVAPLLLATLLFGPAGLVGYLLVRPAGREE